MAKKGYLRKLSGKGDEVLATYEIGGAVDQAGVDAEFKRLTSAGWPIFKTDAEGRGVAVKEFDPTVAEYFTFPHLAGGCRG